MADDDKEKAKTEKPTDAPSTGEDPGGDSPLGASADKPTAAAPTAGAASVEPGAERAPRAAAAGEGSDAAAGDADEDAADEGDEDAFRPEAIAKRIDNVGEDDAIERQAREEERKLAERRKAQKKAGLGKKKGLESAASKRLAKIGEKAAVKRPSAVTAVDAGDPLLERTARLSKWARENLRVVAGLAVLAGLALGGWSLYRYFEVKKANQASLVLTQAIDDERGRIGDPDKEQESPDKAKDPRPMFKTNDLRLESALGKYRDVGVKFPGTGAAILARLGEAAILLDKKDTAGAIRAYLDVKASALAGADGQVKARAVEGLGFAYEQKAQKPEDKDKALADALAAFKELAAIEGFDTLGQYHQARVLEAKGDKAEATKILKDLHEKVSKAGEKHPYLQLVVDDRLRALDPAALPPKAPPNPFGGGLDEGDPEMQRMIQEIMKKQGKAGGPK